MSIKDDTLQFYNSLSKTKVGDIREYRIHAERVCFEDNFMIKLELLQSVLKNLAHKGWISFMVYDDFNSFDKIIKIRREQ